MIRHNFLENLKRLWKLLLAIGRGFLIFLICVNSILGASVYSIGMSVLVVESRKFHGSYFGTLYRGTSSYYDAAALVFGILVYIVISGLAFYPITKMLRPEDTLPYSLGVMFGVSFFFFNTYILMLLVGGLLAVAAGE